MRFFHLSDLHLGKRVNEFPMIEDQKYILQQIIRMADENSPDAVVIAGDVYDKSVPPAEAVELFDDFLVKLAARKLQVFIISGNHDSPERLAFGNRLIDASGIHLSPVYSGNVTPVTLSDEYGPVCFYMLPFIKPATVRRFFGDTEISSYTDAVRTAVGQMNIDRTVRNVLVTHQFVTGAERSESEDISVGGTDNVDASVFGDFDYVALGHIHGPQNIESERIRYCGTPLKYSFSEASHRKSVTVVDLGDKNSISVSELPLVPLRDMKEIRGRYDELMAMDHYRGTTLQEDYVRVTLTDEEDIPDAVSRLRTVYHNIMKLDYDNARTRNSNVVSSSADVETKSPLQLFSEFYEQQNGTEMCDEQKSFLESLIEKIWGCEQ